MFTKLFWKDSLERAISTAAQAAIALFTADGVVGVLDIDFGQGASVVALSAALSLLKSIAAAGIKKDAVSPASLVN